MAVFFHYVVSPASRDDADELDERVRQIFAATGGPPAGLMSHLVHPDGEGFAVADVWRSEAEGRAFLEEVVFGVLAEMGLSAGPVTVRAVWSFARP